MSCFKGVLNILVPANSKWVPYGYLRKNRLHGTLYMCAFAHRHGSLLASAQAAIVSKIASFRNCSASGVNLRLLTRPARPRTLSAALLHT
jgi:hypothetical protein